MSSVAADVGEVPMPTTSFREIVVSSLLIGGSSMLSLVIGLLRTKLMALLLGPAGFGLMGLYAAIADLVRSGVEMGINGSGVRQIAASAASGDAQRLLLTVRVLRRASLLLGLLGVLLMLLLARPLSWLSFGDGTHADALALLSLAVLLRLVSDAQGALLQGLRRISEIARIGVVAAAGGCVVSLPLIYVWREDGIAPALVAVAAVSLLVSWWYGRGARAELALITPPSTPVPLRAMWREAAPLLKLGAAFMAGGMTTLAAGYVVRLIVIEQGGLEAAGHYQAAWSLGGLYVGFVLQAMGTDFYPRLAAAAANDIDVNRLVNEQAQVSLLLAAAGIALTLTLAPWVLRLFYSARFDGAVGVLRWMCLGMALRVISWPLGYVIVAKGRQGLYFAAELAWALAHVGLAWIGVRLFGLAGAGMAFCAAYVLQALLVVAIGRRLTGFRWSAANRRALLLFVALLVALQAGFTLLPAPQATAFGLVASGLAALLSARALWRLLDRGQALPGPLRRFARSFVRPITPGSP